jgi:hypothetical protein
MIMIKLTNDTDYNIYTEVKPLNDGTDSKLIVFRGQYESDAHEPEFRKVSELILDKQAAARLIILLQEQFLFPDK